MAFKTSEKYKSVIYSGDCRHKLKLLFNGVELEDADVYCESLKVTSRILANGSTRFSLDNFIAKEAELILHDIDTTKIQSPVNISIGTLVDGTYEYVPIGLFVVQDLPTTDKNKTTIKLRDYAVKFDFGYNAKDIIDENGGSVTKLQILQDICNKAGVETDITKFYGSNSKIGIYDNTITGRTYISYLAEQAGSIATIDRSGKLIFVQLKDLETVEIPLNIVEKYEDGEKYEISRVVYEDAIRKFEYGDESKDTLFINTANPYIDNEVLTDTLIGTKIEVSDSADAEVVGYKQNGIRTQNVYSGKNKNVRAEEVKAGSSNVANAFTNLTEYDGYKNVVEVSSSVTWMTLNTNGMSPDFYEKVETGGFDVTTMLLIKKTDVNTRVNFYLGSITGGAVYNELKHYKDETNGWTWYYTTHTIPDNPSITTINNHISSPATNFATFYIAKIQTLIGSTPSDFEPYVGGKASPSPDYPQEIEVGRGKNLFNPNNIEQGGFNYHTGENYASNVNIRNIIYDIEPNTQYTISCNEELGEASVCCFDSNNNSLDGNTSSSTTKKSWTFTTKANTSYIKIRIGNSAYPKITSGNYDIQLEKGSKATSYLPYNTIETKTKTRNLYPSSSDIPTGYYAGAVKDYENLHNGDVSLYTDKAWQGVYFNLKEIIAKNNLKIGDKLTCSIYFKTNFVHTGNLRFVFYRPTTSSYNGVTTFASDEVKPNEWKRLSFTFEITEYSLTSERARIEAEFYDANDKYYFGNNRTNYVWFASPQVEVEELTDYQVSKENSTTYNLGDNFLADKDYIQDGILNKYIGKVVLNGSEGGWAKGSDEAQTENTNL